MNADENDQHGRVEEESMNREIGRRAAEPSETRSARDVHRRDAVAGEDPADLDMGDTATPIRHPNRPERKKAGGNFNGPQKG